MSNNAFTYRPLRTEREFRFLVLEPGLADVRTMILMSYAF